MNQEQVILTRNDLLNAAPSERAGMVEQYALTVLGSLRPAGAKPLTGSSRLADAGMDSLQVVEVKFSLDELLGRESEVEMFISNPTIRKLTEDMVRAAGL